MTSPPCQPAVGYLGPTLRRSAEASAGHWIPPSIDSASYFHTALFQSFIRANTSDLPNLTLIPKNQPTATKPPTLTMTTQITQPVHIIALITPTPGNASRVEDLLSGMIKDVWDKENTTSRYHMHRQIGTAEPEIVMIETCAPPLLPPSLSLPVSSLPGSWKGGVG